MKYYTGTYNNACFAVICMASGVEHCAALDGIVSGDITVTGAQVCCIRWDELVTVEMRLDEVVSVEIGEVEHRPRGGLIGSTSTSASSLSAMGEGAATDEVASSPGGRNDRLVHTVMRMRLIFLMNIHKNHCLGGAC